MSINLIDLGPNADYQETLELQRSIREKLITDGGAPTIIFCEHPPTITLGRGADKNHILASESELTTRGIKIFEIERGGEVTYHGPGQIVCYPILDLNTLKRDISWYMRNLELVIIATLKEFGITGEQFPGQAGVWLNLGKTPVKKIASVGVHLSKWRTIHGLALNYLPQTDSFSTINPCGFKDIEITSISEEASQNKDNITYDKIREILFEKQNAFIASHYLGEL